MSEVAVIPRRMSEATPAQGCVLIVDDEAEIRESLQTLLELEGYEVETAANGEEGLSKLGDRPFDLVLLDLALPGRSGIDLLPEIRALDAQLPVIIITAFGTVEDAVRAMQGGAGNFLQKPWDNEKLLADVRAAVAGAAQKKKTSSSSARSSSATTSKTSWARASPCSRFSTWWRRWRPAARPCCCKAKAEPARN